MSSALIVSGGYEPHEPMQVAEVLAEALREEGFEVEIAPSLDAFGDADLLAGQDLIVPNWTSAEAEPEQVRPLLDAVRAGAGIAGLHGGMGCTLAGVYEYQHMVGGQFVCHPGGFVDYRVEITAPDHPIMAGAEDFTLEQTELYYMHIDPAIEVLAEIPVPGEDVRMPAVWTHRYGEGRVFYCSPGHDRRIVSMPEVLAIMTRGMLWAAGEL
ncbi:MAG: ThuA domain-containing protein [Armatimonadota bacterium]|nr:ThuA domain-containing protein [Armatimonadota bacterium]